MGLDYLTLDRLTSTLSGGETQRIQLATSLGSNLVGALYVLDEPSIGLHPRDTNRLILNPERLARARQHAWSSSSTIPTLYPCRGQRNGPRPGRRRTRRKINFCRHAPRPCWPIHTRSPDVTSRGELRIPVPQRRRASLRQIPKIFGACSHNLKNVDVIFPLGHAGCRHRRVRLGQIHACRRCALQGVAGQAHRPATTTSFAPRIEGDNNLTEVEMIDQSPIGRTPRLESRHLYEGVRSDSRSFCLHAGSQKARPHARPFLVQYSRRTLRSVPGRRHGNRRSAVSSPTWS